MKVTYLTITIYMINIFYLMTIIYLILKIYLKIMIYLIIIIYLMIITYLTIPIYMINIFYLMRMIYLILTAYLIIKILLIKHQLYDDNYTTGNDNLTANDNRWWLCFLGIQEAGSGGVWSTLLSLQSLGLAYLQLEDHSADFGEFLQETAVGNAVACSALFTQCSHL